MPYHTEYLPGLETVKTRLDMASCIDDTSLVFQNEDQPEEIISSLCHNALKEGFRAVCIRPEYISLAKSILLNSCVKVATVIAFPKSKLSLVDELKIHTVGDVVLADKLSEIDQALMDGADELDIVMNVSLFKTFKLHEDSDSLLIQEFSKIVKHAGEIPIKLIIETDLLNEDEIILATRLAASSGIRFVKTSTGMLEGGKGATVENIRLIKETLNRHPDGRQVGIKASGGIRTAEQALLLLKSGADILGCSAGSKLLDDFETWN